MAIGLGRGGAGAVVLLHGVLLPLCLVLHSDAAVYTVGDGAGWTFNVDGWPSGKQFHAGDQLVFKYSPAAHNVAVVDAAGYSNCTAGAGSTVFTSGNDVITLGEGTSYYICTFPGHCNGGMKVAVTTT